MEERANYYRNASLSLACFEEAHALHILEGAVLVLLVLKKVYGWPRNRSSMCLSLACFEVCLFVVFFVFGCLYVLLVWGCSRYDPPAGPARNPPPQGE